MSSSAVGPRPTHCLFRVGTFWLALPVEVIRKVMPRPGLVTVPGTSEVIVGICHVQGQFLPVLTLASLFSKTAGCDEPHLLLIDDLNGPWGVLADEVSTLATLELSNVPDSETEGGWETVVMGWATHDRKVVRILDHVRLRELAEQEVNARC